MNVFLWPSKNFFHSIGTISITRSSEELQTSQGIQDCTCDSDFIMIMSKLVLLYT